MKKVFLLLTATAIMLAVGVYSLVDTKNVVGLMTLSEVEALARSEGESGGRAPREIKVQCCVEWEYDYTDAQGVDHLRCKRMEEKSGYDCTGVLRVGLANLIISGLNVINGEASSRFCLVL